jgi:hypothetical protein
MAKSVQELWEQSTGGPPSFFNRNSPVGASITGTVVKSDVNQKTDYEDGTPQTWKDGSPVEELWVVLQTNLRDPLIEDDDGQRRVYIRWFGSDKRNLVAAVNASGDPYLRDGATLTMTFSGYGEQKDKKLNPPKIYEFVYLPPPSPTEALMTKANGAATIPQQYAPAQPQPDLVQQAAATQRTQAAAQHVATAPAAPAPPAGDRAALVAQVRELAAEGFDAELISATVPGLSLKAITAILNIKV